MFSKMSAITESNFIGQKISHVILTEDESVDIEDDFTFWLVKKIIENKNEINTLRNKKITRGY